MKKQDLEIKMKKIGSVPPLCANGDLAVRCAKAELELEREREFRKTNLAILASMKAREFDSAQETKRLGALLDQKNSRLEALRGLNRALVDQVSEYPSPSAPGYPDFPEPSGFDPFSWFFGLAVATGLCTWAWVLFNLGTRLLGRFGG